MKKIVSLLLILTMALTIVACGANEGTETKAPETTDTTAPETEAAGVEVKDATELLNTIWGVYAEEEKFACGGGDADNMSMEGAGAFGLTDAEALDSTSGFPAAEIAKIDGAATLMHMMNANSFTGAAYHLVNADDAQAVAEAILNNLKTRQWMCGFPDKLVVYTIGDYVVSAFGVEEIIETFKANTVKVYPTAVLAVEEPLI